MGAYNIVIGECERQEARDGGTGYVERDRKKERQGEIWMTPTKGTSLQSQMRRSPCHDSRIDVKGDGAKRAKGTGSSTPRPSR